MFLTGGITSWKQLGSYSTGAAPDTPDQFIGTLNDYDVPFVRNNIEIMRLKSAGLIIGGTSFAGGGTGAKLDLQNGTSTATILRETFSPAGQSVTHSHRLARTSTAGAVSSDVDFLTLDDVNTTYRVITTVRQTGGGVGAAGDGASFIDFISLKNIGGVTTILSSPNQFTYRIDAGITLVFSAFGANLRATCTGVAGRNLRWGILLDTLAV